MFSVLVYSSPANSYLRLQYLRFPPPANSYLRSQYLHFPKFPSVHYEAYCFVLIFSVFAFSNTCDFCASMMICNYEKYYYYTTALKIRELDVPWSSQWTVWRSSQSPPQSDPIVWTLCPDTSHKQPHNCVYVTQWTHLNISVINRQNSFGSAPTVVRIQLSYLSGHHAIINVAVMRTITKIY